MWAIAPVRPRDIARQSRMAGRVHHPRAHRVADLEARRRGCRPFVGRALRQQRGDTFRRQVCASAGRRRPAAMPVRELGRRDEVVLDQQALQAHQPYLVIARGEIFRRRDALARVPRPCRCSTRRCRSWRATAPRRGAPTRRGRPARPAPARSGPKPCAPPRSCGPFMPRRGESGRPVPIIESRVTRRQAPPRPAFRAGRTHRHDEVADLGGGIPDADPRRLRQRHAELGEHAARIDDGARAVGRRLVPDRRQAEHGDG